MAPRFHSLTINDIRRETPDAVSICFDVPEDIRADFAFEAGQYLTLRTKVNGEECRRSYSICSGLDDGEIRVAVKKVEGGRFSSLANDNLKVGDRLDVMTPMGRFVAPIDGKAKTYLAIAAGSGITPVMAMIRTVLIREPQSRFVLLYGNKTSGSIIFKTELEDLKDRYLGRLSVHHVLSQEPQELSILHGRLDAERTKALVSHAVDVRQIDHAFLCGPEGLINDARAALTGLGLDSGRIQAELFTPADGVVRKAPPAPASAATVATISLQLDGATHTIPYKDNQTVLEAAAAAGVDIPYSCAGGMCCTCRAKVTSGEVAMDVNYSLEPWEIEADFVLTCQSRVVKGPVMLDYDAM